MVIIISENVSVSNNIKTFMSGQTPISHMFSLFHLIYIFVKYVSACDVPGTVNELSLSLINHIHGLSKSGSSYSNRHMQLQLQ